VRAENVEVADPVDTAAVARWNAAVAAARAAVVQHTMKAAQVDATLRLENASSPAARARDALDAARTAQQLAGVALDTRQTEQATADNALKTADAALKVALGAEAAATKRLSDALGAVMATATTSTALTATVDGLALRERYRTALTTTPQVWDVATVPFRATTHAEPVDPQVRLPVVGDTDHTALLRVLSDLDDSVDAIADLVAAEGVHQLVGGNLVRSGAALEIAASGAVPDELDVITTPASGHDVTHRVLVIGEPAPTAPGAGAATGVLAGVDPAFVTWLATLIPDPHQVHLQAAALDTGSGSVLASVDLRADALNLDAADWVRVSADPGELAARVAHVARPALAAALGAEIEGPVVCGPGSGAVAGTGLEQLLAGAGAARRLLGSVRALQPGDLAAPGREPAPPTTAHEQAAVRAVAAAQDALAALDANLAAADAAGGTGAAHPGAGGPTDEDIVATLLRATALGLSEATPPLAAGSVDRGTLQRLAVTARARLAARLQVPRFTASPEGTQATVDAARAVLPTLLGTPVPLLLPVALPDDAILRSDLREAGVPLAPPAEVRDWLLDHATVRPTVAALVDAYDTAEALGASGQLRVRATQVPREPRAPWAGSDPRPAAGLTGLAVVRTGGTALPDTVAGLVVDSWVQTVPRAGHDAALAFHYDEPDADPPQAILVAVPGSTSPQHVPAAWGLADLVGVVTSTMSQAAGRAVAAELVDGASVTIRSPR
jgi:hypothetical protein